MNDLTLVIPAKFESESLPFLLDELKYYKCKKLVVLQYDDIATINSVKKYNDVEIFYQNELGYGAALIQGIDFVSTNYFCIINADGSMQPSDLKRMFNSLEDNKLDFIFASRYESPGGGSDDDDFITTIGNFVFTKLGNILFSLDITDILFTYVMGRTKSFNNLMLKSKDFTICVEFPILVKRKKYKYLTIPSYERNRIAGKKKVNVLKDGLLILIKMIKMFIFR